MTNRDIQKAANGFLRDHPKESGIPVNVELLVEKMEFYIVPLPGLRFLFGIDACSRVSTGEIYVDSDYYLNPKMGCRFRFTLGHELGHFILHDTEYRSIESTEIKTGVEWAKLVRDNLLRNAWLENEADEFSGELLVPRHELVLMLPEAVDQAKHIAQQYHWEFGTLSIDAVRNMLGLIIAPRFDVTPTVVEIRIRKHGLYPPTAGTK